VRENLADHKAGVDSGRGFTRARRAQLGRWLPWVIIAESKGLLAVSLVFILTDAFLTLMIYGPGLSLGG
jgi:hypothetical protein